MLFVIICKPTLNKDYLIFDLIIYISYSRLSSTFIVFDLVLHEFMSFV